MTIEEVMSQFWCAAIGCKAHDKEAIRAALLALVAQARDEEAEACIKISEPWITPEQIRLGGGGPMTAIRARIAARAEGGKHD